ncbi:ral guanine nucleotide dissociation stimulator-like [Dasypus novemcinctus]|uniref:ral guanine nucleotide dissociation stimulator-like n=1 Tax=Dasypus novemcinctus TaxID=9361 RepID=UPI00265E881C|nr:ral guanine nucleotide dissociation stimulator-like [Dasypus novemcinctus]XP_058145478.1 ral guanine nucleotide dissociation stimulator-like [Dasypus novemcinctus]XP_058148567.1 ral guanine nucleotide dissociation stimulator-like [Dasypus novemcinctus]
MLSAIFSQSWELIIKEEICKFATLELKPTRAQKKVQQLKKEYQMITELQQLQAGCCYDSLMTNEQFGAWFGDMKQLSKKYSYHLFCKLEPPSHLASKNFKDKHHLEGIKPLE